MATITAIEIQKRRPDRVNIDLDGEFAFSLAAIVAAGLKVGAALDPDRIAALQAEDADESAFQRALRLLSLRDRSEAELRTHLRKHKTPEDVLERTLVRLREHRHADDADFRPHLGGEPQHLPAARPPGAGLGAAAQRASHPRWPKRPLPRLDETALAYQAGLKKARQLVTSDWQDFRTKVSAYLARRGFPFGSSPPRSRSFGARRTPGKAPPMKRTSHESHSQLSSSECSALIVGVVVGYLLHRLQTERLLRNQQDKADNILRVANEQARLIDAQARESATKIVQASETEIKERRIELSKETERLDKRRTELDGRAEKLEQRDQTLNKRQSAVDKRANEMEKLYEDQVKRLEEIGQLTHDEAKKELLAAVEKESRADMARIYRQIEAEAREEGEKRARKLIADAIQRVASEHVAEVTSSVVPLPNEEMKGRIVGRNGRNIKAFEQAAGVDVIVDDTPEAVTISCFDSVRREIARRALARLTVDGRIHPAHIEKILEEEAQGRRSRHRRGRRAGRLRGRHRRPAPRGAAHDGPAQVPHVLRSEPAGARGRSLQARRHPGRRARRQYRALQAGRLPARHRQGHGPQPGWHARQAGRRVLQALRRESDGGQRHRVASSRSGPAQHRGRDRRSRRRHLRRAPGARREDLEAYIKRIRTLEELSQSFEGVGQAFAIQAGREVRVIVKPENIDDLASARLARDIAKKIEESMQYPGQIKVTVIRETRATEYAK